MKKFFITFLTAVLIIASVVAVAPAALACETSECHNLFTDTLDKLLDENNINEAVVYAETEKIYDMELRELGCLYDFTVNGTRGFALMIFYGGHFQIAEIYLDGTNPYEGCQGKKVYPSAALYLYNFDNNFYEASSNLMLDESSVQAISDKAYMGGGVVTQFNETIYYTHKSENDYWLSYIHPNYVGIAGVNNICVPIAAGNIIGYWDRFKPNLIAGYEPGELWNGEYFYDENTTEIDNMILQLASDMGAGNGTSVAQCKSGMEKYCERAGYSISFTNLMTLGVFKYTTAKNKLQAGEPLLLFTQGFTVRAFSTKNGYDSVTGITSTGNHSMAGFGFLDVTYTFSNGSERTDKFICVASGQSTLKAGYFNIGLTSIDNAYSVKIS